jgi:hypothetical protein
MPDRLLADRATWFVIDVVDQLDLQAFHRIYRADGHDRPAYGPAFMVRVLPYACCTGVRSSPRIQRCRREQVCSTATGAAGQRVALGRRPSGHDGPGECRRPGCRVEYRYAAGRCRDPWQASGRYRG